MFTFIYGILAGIGSAISFGSFGELLYLVRALICPVRFDPGELPSVNPGIHCRNTIPSLCAGVPIKCKQIMDAKVTCQLDLLESHHQEQ